MQLTQCSGKIEAMSPDVESVDVNGGQPIRSIHPWLAQRRSSDAETAIALVASEIDGFDVGDESEEITLLDLTSGTGLEHDFEIDDKQKKTSWLKRGLVIAAIVMSLSAGPSELMVPPISHDSPNRRHRSKGFLTKDEPRTPVASLRLPAYASSPRRLWKLRPSSESWHADARTTRRSTRSG